MNIELISFDEILPIWKGDLWPQRTSAIEPYSWIDPSGQINMQQTFGPVSYWGLRDENNLLGVVSGYKTGSQFYRSRGLWVSSAVRGLGWGRQLISQLENQAKSEDCNTVWTMPRASAWAFYKSCGFIQAGYSDQFEFGPHILAQKKI